MGASSFSVVVAAKDGTLHARPVVSCLDQADVIEVADRRWRHRVGDTRPRCRQSTAGAAGEPAGDRVAHRLMDW